MIARLQGNGRKAWPIAAGWVFSLGGNTVAGFFDGRTWQVLTKALEAASLRQRVIAHNVANLNTPGFKKSQVRFEEELRAALDSSRLPLYRTHPQHLDPRPRLDAVSPRVVREEETAARPDGNNVDLNEQMVQLAMNSLYYQVAVQAVNSYLGRLRYVITGIRR